MFISPQAALITGLILSLLIKDRPIQGKIKKWSSQVLQLSVVILGSSLLFQDVLNQGVKNILMTFLSISAIIISGLIGIRLFKLDREVGQLITSGTAICGGSAIGALSSAIKANANNITIAISVVFLLNTLAVFIFPPLGHYLEMTQIEFGQFAALAIHDTSSVVAASAIYGEEALKTATTLKLIRALWIIPVTYFFIMLQKDKTQKQSIPWFIVGFISMSLLFSFVEALAPIRPTLTTIAKNGFSLALFLIGSTFNYEKLKEVGFKSILFAVILWFITIAVSLILIKFL